MGSAPADSTSQGLEIFEKRPEKFYQVKLEFATYQQLFM